MLKKNPISCIKFNALLFLTCSVHQILFGCASAQKIQTQDDLELTDLKDFSPANLEGQKKDQNEPLKKSKGVSLPFPKGISYFELQTFLEDSRTAYAAYAPLKNEYDLFARNFKSESILTEDELNSMKIRVEENFERSHWVYFYGIWDASDYLMHQSKESLQIDREKNFVVHMKTIAFIATALDNLSNGTSYLKFLQKNYISMSKRHFDRVLNSRDEKK